MLCSSQNHIKTGTCDLDHPILTGAENTDNNIVEVTDKMLQALKEIEKDKI
jgi:hypothetical protein